MAETLDALVEQCIACHGDGTRRDLAPATPLLGDQPSLYTLYQLVYFRQGQREQPEMNDLLGDLDDETLRALADWAASLPRPPPSGEADPARYRRGAAIVRRHRCTVCHNPDFSGEAHVPRLAGQDEGYLLKALRDYKAGARIGVLATMAETLVAIDEDELVDLAHYLAHFRP